MNVTMDDLVLLSEDKAVDRWFDMHNYRWFVRFLLVLFVVATWQLSMLTLDISQPPVPFMVNLTILTGCFLLFLFRRKLSRSFQPVLIFFLFFQMALLFVAREHFEGISYWMYVQPVLLLFFRLRPLTNLFLYGSIILAAVLDCFLPSEMALPHLIGLGANAMTCMVLAVLWRTVKRRQFLAVWRIECNNRERLRMKEELNHARDIQLSMLPPGRPEIAHLDIACTSIPATEVGGDYFDYFKLSGNELMLVIGDVSGHGVASGLVLSGVRSCLYLFEQSLPAPGPLLVKLNRMLKKTTDKRMFMTFMAVHFDTHRSRLVFSCAGHPPLLHYCRVKATLNEVRKTALPLGALMDTQYPEQALKFEYGDVFLFYTDGLIEARNPAGEEYGLERLMKRFKTQAARGASSEKIREVLMTDVQLFIKDSAQLDDISLVVVGTHQVEHETSPIGRSS